MRFMGKGIATLGSKINSFAGEVLWAWFKFGQALTDIVLNGMQAMKSYLRFNRPS